MTKLTSLVFLLTALLTACSGGNSPYADEESSEPEPRAIYRVAAEDLSLSLLTGETIQAEDAATWRAVAALLPNDKLKNDVAEYHVFTDGEEDTLAYVSQLEDDDNKWLFAVDSVDAKNKQSKTFVTTVTHEFAHILALEKDQVMPGIGKSDCTQIFWMEEGCPIANAHILNYFNQFWRGDLYAEHQTFVEGLEGLDKEDAVAEFYDLHQDKFINEYSATDPIEDFAETFSYFVFIDQIEFPEETREQKINYFYDIPSFVAVRDHIRAQTTIRRDGIDD